MGNMFILREYELRNETVLVDVRDYLVSWGSLRILKLYLLLSKDIYLTSTMFYLYSN